MVIVYILIGILLIAAAVYWVRLERKKAEDDVTDKVEPDLNGLFDDASSVDNTNAANVDQVEINAIDHDDLSYRPKVETALVEDAPIFAETPKEDIAEIAFADEDRKPAGFFNKLSGLFRGKRADMAIYSDDGNLMRPASVETVALILSAAPDQPYSFKEILTVAHELDLRVENGGFIQLLTTTHYGDEPMYSIGHLLGDGTFDENLVRYHLEDTTPGLIFFSKIPGPDPDISTIEQLLAGIHHFSSALGGKILDTNQRVMSKDDLIELFHKINKLDNEEWERAYEAYETRNRE